MTHIVSPARYPTKKAFKEAIVAKGADSVFCDDPSFFGTPCSGSVQYILENYGRFCVTNHPKRTWFAEVSLGKDGKAKVS